MKNETKKITLAGMLIALGIILAFIFHSLEAGQLFSPMHITVLLAGIILGWKYGLAVGVITPLLNSIIFTRPPLFPIALGMALELATYGLIIGLVYRYLKIFKSNIFNIYFALIIAMLAGRIIYGLYYGMLIFLINYDFGFNIFIANAVIIPLPGIILQLILIPTLVSFLEKNNFLDLKTQAN